MVGNTEQHPEPPTKTTVVQKARDKAVQIGQLTGDFIQNSNKFYLLSTTSVLLILVALAIIRGGPLVYRLWAGQPPRMTGDFNIAVAEFVQIPPVSSPEQLIAPIASQKIYDFLEAEYRLSQFGSGVAVSHDARFGAVRSEEGARQLADQIGADLVIYGNVTVVGDQASITVQFYVDDSYRPDTSELRGIHKLVMPPFERTELIEAGSTVSTLLRDRTALFVEFTKAVAYLATDDLESARASTDRALDYASRFPELEGQEVLYLMRAEIRRLEEDFEGAQEDIDAILELNPTYGRAYIAQANTYFVQDQLDLAQRAYEEALALKGQPQGAYISEKANLGLGNISMTRFLTAAEGEKEALGEDALAHYEKVVAAYKDTPREQQGRTLRELAAWAHGFSGVIYHTWGEWQKAIDGYEAALSLSDDEDVRRIFAPELEKLK